MYVGRVLCFAPKDWVSCVVFDMLDRDWGRNLEMMLLDFNIAMLQVVHGVLRDGKPRNNRVFRNT